MASDVAKFATEPEKKVIEKAVFDITTDVKVFLNEKMCEQLVDHFTRCTKSMRLPPETFAFFKHLENIVGPSEDQPDNLG